MSHNVTTDVVPFQAYLGSGDQMGLSLLQKLCEPMCWLESREEDVTESINDHGWQLLLDDGEIHFGKKGRLYGWPWTKGNFTVICWNSSSCSNGGYLEGTVASNDRESIEIFLADFKEDLDLRGFKGEIQEDDTAKLWG